MGRMAWERMMIYIPISIHPSRVGWDEKTEWHRCHCGYFNPPIPWGMGRVGKVTECTLVSISIHPSRVGWDFRLVLVLRLLTISIHPSRVGWDESTS